MTDATESPTDAVATESAPVVETTAPAAAESTSATQGSAPSDFFSMLPAEMQADKAFAKLKGKSAEEFGKAYQHAVSKIGAKTVTIPDADAPAEAWAEYRAGVGAPEDATGYEFKAPEGLPEGLELDEAKTEWFRSVADKLHLSKGQAGQLYKEYLALQGEQFTQAAAQREEAHNTMVQSVEAELRKEFGLAFDDRMTAAYDVLKKLEAPESVTKAIQALPGEERVAMIKTLSKVAREMEDSTIVGGSSRQASMTPAEATEEINRLYADEKSGANPRFYDAANPLHAATRNRLLELYRLQAG